MKNEIILYQSGELAEHIEVRLDEDTVWLNRNQIATLFGRDVKTIGKHINNVFSEGELDKNSTVAKFATVQLEGGREIERNIEYYNLDVIAPASKDLQSFDFASSLIRNCNPAICFSIRLLKKIVYFLCLINI